MLMCSRHRRRRGVWRKAARGCSCLAAPTLGTCTGRASRCSRSFRRRTGTRFYRCVRTSLGCPERIGSCVLTGRRCGVAGRAQHVQPGCGVLHGGDASGALRASEPVPGSHHEADGDTHHRRYRKPQGALLNPSPFLAPTNPPFQRASEGVERKVAGCTRAAFAPAWFLAAERVCRLTGRG